MVSFSDMERDKPCCFGWQAYYRRTRIQHESPVGVSLLAMASCHLALNVLTHRYREQAHSYRDQCEAKIEVVQQLFRFMSINVM
ncbi:hypothetical protein EMIT0232MI5_30025 [Pseudomonas sp. IT-232MI5]